jgi:biopolymer transport protein ExbB/TolQ
MANRTTVINDLLILAKAHPKDVALNWAFWKRQPQAPLYFGLSIFIFIVLFRYSFSIKMNPLFLLFTIGVTALLIVGIWQIVLSIAKIEIEIAYAQYVEIVSEDILRDVKSGNRILNVSEMRTLLPNNKDAVMARLFTHIVTEAEAHKFESNLTTIQPYKEDILFDLVKIGEIQKNSLHVGILGTFIGLMGAFISLGSKGIEAVFDDLIKSLTFAFGTSIGGIRNSIILSILSRMLHKKHEILFVSLENATDSLLTLGRKSLNRDDIAAEFDQVRESVGNLSQKVEFQNQIVNRQTQDIQMGIDRLVESKEQLNQFLITISLKEAGFLNEIQHVYDKISPESISQQLNQNLEKVVNNITTTLQHNLKETLDQYKELNTSVSVIYDYLKMFDQQLRNQLQLSTDNVTKSKEEIFTSLSEMAKHQKDFVASITNLHIAEELKKSILTAGNQIAQKYETELHSMLPHVQMLGQELKTFNEITQDDMVNQRPPLIALKILTLIGKLFKSTAQFIFSIFRNKP